MIVVQPQPIVQPVQRPFDSQYTELELSFLRFPSLSSSSSLGVGLVSSALLQALRLHSTYVAKLDNDLISFPLHCVYKSVYTLIHGKGCMQGLG